MKLNQYNQVHKLTLDCQDILSTKLGYNIEIAIIKIPKTSTQATIKEYEKKIEKIFKYPIQISLTKIPISKKLPLQKIFKVVADKFEITIEDIKGKSRKRGVPEARFIVSHIIKEYNPDFKLVKIGTIMGNKDHSVICFYNDRFKECMQTDYAFSQKYQEISIELEKEIEAIRGKFKQ